VQVILYEFDDWFYICMYYFMSEVLFIVQMSVACHSPPEFNFCRFVKQEKLCEYS
jgi:hypothetical protein